MSVDVNHVLGGKKSCRCCFARPCSERVLTPCPSVSTMFFTLGIASMEGYQIAEIREKVDWPGPSVWMSLQHELGGLRTV